MDGRSHMPLRAFCALLDLVASDEASRAAPAHAAAGAQALRFNIGAVFARCERCANEIFDATTSVVPPPLSAELACRACGQRIMHRELLATLARRAFEQRMAAKEARVRYGQRSTAIERASEVGLS